MHHGGGWWAYLTHDESNGKPTVTRDLLSRVYQYAKPYTGSLLMTLLLITLASLLDIIPPLLYRDLFDTVIPNKDFTRLNWLAVGMIGIPILSDLLNVAQRYFNARLGEGVIYDLRQQLYEHLQRMGILF